MVLFLIAGNAIIAQGLENIIVERYFETDSANSQQSLLPEGSVTYRIYADLAEGFNLQTIFGYPNHELIIETTTTFYNHPLGSGTGDNIDGEFLEISDLAFDSWITIGAASKQYFGIPLASDTDGSIMKNHYISSGDGLTPMLAPKIIKYKVNLSAFESGETNKFFINNALLGVMGGVKGTTKENKVLLAQVTTNGELSFELNLQVGSENSGNYVRYVARNPQKDEIQFKGLIYNK